MLNRRFALCSLAVLAFAGACADTQPTEPAGSPEQGLQLFRMPSDAELQANLVNNHDADLARIAREVPGYGGHYYDETGTLNVVMTADAVTRAPDAVGRVLADRLTALNIDVAAQPLRVRTGEYDFDQLHTMHRRAHGLLSMSSVVFTDADERANRVAIGVVDEAAARRVAEGLEMLGLPAEAVEIRITERVEFMQTLQNRVRPVAGGLQINFPGFLCTLGVNVRTPHPGGGHVHGFLTNSHCTNVQWSFNPSAPTPYWQPSGSAPNTSDPNFIGLEAHDAPPTTGGACPAGRICRASDAAGARYATGIDNAFARIYRTTGVNSLTIDPSNPFYTITAEAPTNLAMGDSVYKVGRTTGFTRGVVTGSCVNTNLAPNMTYFCQDWVTGPTSSVGGGDSGSSTWTPAPLGQSQNVRVNGLLCCGAGSSIFIYSPMSGIRSDNPPLNPAAPWRIHP